MLYFIGYGNSYRYSQLSKVNRIDTGSTNWYMYNTKSASKAKENYKRDRKNIGERGHGHLLNSVFWHDRKDKPINYQQYGCLNKMWITIPPVDMLIWIDKIS